MSEQNCLTIFADGFVVQVARSVIQKTKNELRTYYTLCYIFGEKQDELTTLEGNERTVLIVGVVRTPSASIGGTT